MTVVSALPGSIVALAVAPELLTAVIDALPAESEGPTGEAGVAVRPTLSMSTVDEPSRLTAGANVSVTARV